MKTTNLAARPPSLINEMMISYTMTINSSLDAGSASGGAPTGIGGPTSSA